jgi:hypothetical protein
LAGATRHLQKAGVPSNPEQARKEAQMPKQPSEDERPTEDDLAKEKLGPRGVPGEPQQQKLPRQQQENITRRGKFDGHTA